MPVRVAGAGSGGRFRKVPESSGVCWCRFRRRVPKVPEGSGVGWCRFRRQVPEGSGEASSGRFRRVLVYAGVGSERWVPEGLGRFRKVPESSNVCWCSFRKQVPEGPGEFRYKMVLVPEASSGRFRKISEGSGVCWRRFRR